MSDAEKASDAGVGQARPLLRVFMSTFGTGRDNTMSGWAWYEVGSGRKCVEMAEGLTEKEVAFLAILSIVESLPKGARAIIYCDDPLLNYQFEDLMPFEGKRRAMSARARAILLIRQRDLEVYVNWAIRYGNPARKLLQAYTQDV